MKAQEKKANKKSQLISTLALTSAAVIGNTLPAQALSINFTYAPGVNWYYKAAAETAALYWEDRLSDNATVNIHLDVPDSSKGVAESEYDFSKTRSQAA